MKKIAPKLIVQGLIRLPSLISSPRDGGDIGSVSGRLAGARRPATVREQTAAERLRRSEVHGERIFPIVLNFKE